MHIWTLPDSASLSCHPARSTFFGSSFTMCMELLMKDSAVEVLQECPQLLMRDAGCFHRVPPHQRTGSRPVFVVPTVVHISAAVIFLGIPA